MGPAAQAKGSSVREPGEPLCGGCTSSRLALVRALDRLPSDIHTIRAKRMPRGKKVA